MGQAVVSRRHLLFERVVLIYQMPKIGSQTIEATLLRYSFQHPVYRFHYLSRTNMQNVRDTLASPEPNEAWKSQLRQRLNFTVEMSRLIRLRKLLCICGFRIPKLEIIVGVRELIGLVLSSMFENHLRFVPNLECMTTDKCREVLLGPKMFTTLQDWFDLELKPFTGVDVFKTSFPRDQGFAIYENRFVRALVYRFETLCHLAEVLGKFLCCQIPCLVNRNLSISKQYSEKYEHVKEHLQLPPDFVSNLYSCKMMRHFYSDEERSLFETKWTNQWGEATQAETFLRSELR